MSRGVRGASSAFFSHRPVGEVTLTSRPTQRVFSVDSLCDVGYRETSSAFFSHRHATRKSPRMMSFAPIVFTEVCFERRRSNQSMYFVMLTSPLVAPRPYGLGPSGLRPSAKAPRKPLGAWGRERIDMSSASLCSSSALRPRALGPEALSGSPSRDGCVGASRTRRSQCRGPTCGECREHCALK